LAVPFQLGDIFLGESGGRVSEKFQTIESEVKNPTLEPEGSGTQHPANNVI